MVLSSNNHVSMTDLNGSSFGHNCLSVVGLEMGVLKSSLLMYLCTVFRSSFRSCAIFVIVSPFSKYSRIFEKLKPLEYYIIY